MATYKKLRDGWEAQVAKRGVRKSKTFKRKGDAKEWAETLEREVEQAHVKGFVTTLGTPIQTILIRYKNEAGGDWSVSKSRSVERLIKDMTLTADELTPVRVRDWAMAREYGFGTTRIDLAILMGALKYARDVHFMDVSTSGVAAAVKSLKVGGQLPEVQKRDRRITPDEERLIRGHWQSEVVPPYVVDFLIDTPIRSGEMCALTSDDVDGRIITIRDRKDPKQKHRVDRVPLLGRSVDVMDRTWGKRPFPFAQGTVNEAITAAVAAAGLEGITAHTCRHEGISRMIEGGYGIPQVALVSGHKNWNTLKRYTHITAESLIT